MASRAGAMRGAAILAAESGAQQYNFFLPA